METVRKRRSAASSYIRERRADTGRWPAENGSGPGQRRAVNGVAATPEVVPGAASTVSRIGRLRSFARPSIPSMRDRHRFVIRFGVSFMPGYGGGVSRVRR